MKTSKLTLLAITGYVALLTACSSGISGTYTGKGDDAMFDKISFTSGHSVDITYMGSTTACTFEKKGEKVTISGPGGNQVFTIDSDGCLDGGGMIGKYCK